MTGDSEASLTDRNLQMEQFSGEYSISKQNSSTLELKLPCLSFSILLIIYFLCTITAFLLRLKAANQPGLDSVYFKVHIFLYLNREKQKNQVFKEIIIIKLFLACCLDLILPSPFIRGVYRMRNACLLQGRRNYLLSTRTSFNEL